MEQWATKPGSEQRRDWRYSCDANVVFYDVIASRWISGKLLDLSLSGCLARPDEAGLLRQGDLVEVSFSLFGYSIRISGSVRYVRNDHCMGIMFRARNDSSNWQLGKILQKLAEDSVANLHSQTPR
jgi:hypothetical protein